ncbi:hypothetical protein LOTGIDRAFT_237754 [Lottia gigantea]|uniref:PLAC domain-containing protein n=1 Tax=Lottia gigantea TaxID=225164 RepID=V4B719_LOTGI|nr:hypothetical protein LOTGIDRAFT_237754 [Lottia gigantea]ESP03326.1 hypothetical protein LOTGIDRAFT_237754 [Lottia gigantea]
MASHKGLIFPTSSAHDPVTGSHLLSTYQLMSSSGTLCYVLLSVSKSQDDVCDRCRQYPSTCRKIAGIFMVTVLSKGSYNPVVEIPSPACNINITELSRSRNYIAIKSKSGRSVINGYWRITSPGQHYGVNTVFKYSKSSSADCPGECVYTSGPTNETIIVQLLYYSQNPGISYEFIIPNNVQFKPYEGSRLIGLPRSRISTRRSFLDRHRGRAIIRNQRPQTSVGERNPYSSSERSETPIIRNRQEFQLNTGSQPRVPEQPQIRYGYDTLDGRGLSYTQIKRQPYQSRGGSGRSPLVAPRPQYVSPYNSNSRSYYGRAALTGTSQQIDLPNTINTIVDENVYVWKISGFSDCTQPCGGGYQKTVIVCVLKTTQVTVTHENCNANVKPQAQEVECNTKPCSPRWHTDEWASCSVTCGSGTQIRRLECKQKISNTLELSVSASLCPQDEKPASAQQCEMGRCAEWKVGPWKTCSVSCGQGTRRRSVKCVDHQGSQIPASYCDTSEPQNQEPCDMGPCRTAWLYTPWSNQCSSSCGAGFKTRQVICYSKDGNEVQSSVCDASKKPRPEVSCHSDESCGSKWFTGPWSECSSDCGSGIKNRYVVCMKVVGDAAVVSRDEDCWNSEKPTKQEDCNNHACGSEWFITDWSQCSVTCGTGFKTREVKCLNRNKRLGSGCDSNKRPEPRETCQPRLCPAKLLSAENDGRDLYRSCPLVVRARLCSYKYYQQICCT